MLPPQLRLGVCLTRHRAPLSTVPAGVTSLALGFTSAPVHFYQQNRQWSWYKQGCDGESSLDPSKAHLVRRRHQRSLKAALKDRIRRRTSWDLPLSTVKPCGTRNASHWSKDGKDWQQLNVDAKKRKTLDENFDDYELSPSEKRWKKQVDAMREYIGTNPYRAVFGKPFDPFWAASMWGPMIPSWMKLDEPNAKNVNTPEASEITAKAKDRPTSAKDRPAEHTSHAGRFTAPYAEASSFTVRSSQNLGESPVVEARASSWDSQSNKSTHTKYDPVSNRMVAVEESEDSSSQAVASESSIAAPKMKKTEKLSQEKTESSGKDAINIPIKKYQSPPAIAVDHAPARKPSHIAAKLEKLPKSDLDFLTADDVRASMGKVKHQEKRDRITRENRIAALERDFYEKEQMATKSTEESRQSLAEFLENISRKTKPAGANEKPSIVQPALDRVNAGSSPRKNGASAKSSSVEDIDGYSAVPTGLQTAYKEETAACRAGSRKSLSKEIQDKPKEGLDFDDGYSRTPKGLQVSYAEEQRQPGRPSLAEELAANTKAAQDAKRGLTPQYEDGYTKNPIGLQTSYTKEQEHMGGDLLAQELAANNKAAQDAQRGLTAQVEDWYTQQRIGLQTSYAKEQAQIGSASLEKELSDNARSVKDVARGLTPQAEDGFSEEPRGLEKSFREERHACANGSSETLEQELKQNTALPTQAYADHYPSSPIGLQIMYRQEQVAAKEGKRQSLEDELKTKRDNIANSQLREEVETLKRTMRAYEERLSMNVKSSCPPTSSPQANEQNTEPIPGEGDMCANVTKYADSDKWYKRTNGDRQLKTRLEPGEGDMHADVTKFADSGKWYKQTNSHRERLIKSKATTDTSDRGLARQVDQICREHNLYQSRPSFDSDLVDAGVEKGLAEYDQKTTETRQAGDKSKSSGVEKSVNNNRVEEASPATVSTSDTKASTSPDFAWAEPALYKVLAYDSGNDILRTATTWAKWSDNEKPLSISRALSQLYQPARFVPHFASLQSDGFQVISGSKDFLVFRKVKPRSVAEADEGKTSEPVSEKSSTKAQDMPKQAESSRNKVNPIDGMSRPEPQAVTGNYASPTGFVNYDPIIPHEHTARSSNGTTKESAESVSTGQDVQEEDDTYYRHYPRVHRQEPVFSGSRYQRGGRYGDYDNGHRGGHGRLNGNGGVGKHKRRGQWRHRAKFAFSVGACTALSVYAIGVGAELARGEKGK